MAASRFPDKVNSLVLAGSPIDTDAGDRTDQAHGSRNPDVIFMRSWWRLAAG